MIIFVSHTYIFKILDPPMNARVADEDLSRPESNYNDRASKSSRKSNHSDIHKDYMNPSYEEPKYSLDEVKLYICNS